MTEKPPISLNYAKPDRRRWEMHWGSILMAVLIVLSVLIGWLFTPLLEKHHDVRPTSSDQVPLQMITNGNSP